MKCLRIALMTTVVVLAIAGLSAPAGAHAAYKSSDPPDDGQVSSPPGEVTATFTEPLANGSFLQITDPCGERVDGGDVRIVGYDMSVSMSGVAAGRYTVFYRAFSTLDPHVTEGTFGFTATSGETCAGEEAPAGEGDPPAGSAGREGGGGSVPAASSGSAPSQTDEGSAQADGGAAGAGSRSRSDRGGGDRATANRNRTTTVPGGDQQDQVRLAAQEEEEETPSVWDGIRLEPFLTGLLLAAIIGAAGGKMYAGIMGPRA